MKLVLRKHALLRSRERRVSLEEIEEAILFGDTRLLEEGKTITSIHVTNIM